MATNPRSQLDVIIRGRDELTPELAKLESKIIRVVGAISATLAGIKIAAAPIIAASNFERELANVAKTTNFTRQQIDKLGSSLLEISTRVDVSAVDLAKIAAAAGQQGLGRQGVAGVVAFTDSVARMASVLDISAEEAATNIGKVINVFRIPLSEVERAVSVFNEVSNNSTAEGKELLDVVKRIGDAAGALNLQQSVALAATGLDFGLSPEVVGTSVARVFSAAFEKADEFGKLMNISATQWTERLKTDGLAAFKDFIASLRKLDAQSQQKAIVKLVGGGRIGAFINKLVQDTSNSVLERNFASAKDGLSGLSALREQATVLNTLDAQAKILGNTFAKLGVEAAQSLLGPLAQYAAQLTDALQTPGVKSFVNAAVAAVGQLIDQFASFVKWVSDANINWENFLGVLKAFVGLKLAEMFIGLIGRMSVFSLGLKSISKDANAAADASERLVKSQKGQKTGDDGAAQFKASTAARVLGYEELSIRWQKRMAEIAAEKKAEEELTAAWSDLAKVKAADNSAVRREDRIRQVSTVVDARAAKARTEADNQQAKVLAVEKATNAAREAEQKRFNDRLAANEEASKRRLQDIERKHADNIAGLQRAAAGVRLAEAKAAEQRAAVEQAKAPAGFLRDNVGIRAAEQRSREADAQVEVARKALAAEQAATAAAHSKALQDQKQFHAAAVANITKYHTQRIAALEASGSKEVAAEKALLAQRLAAYQTFAAQQLALQERLAAASVASAAAGAATAGARAALDAAKTAAGVNAATTGVTAAFARMAAGVSTALTGIGVAMRTLVSVAVTVGRLLLNAFFWVTMGYQILDFLGIVDKVRPYFEKLTDKLGLTSKAQRDLKIDAEQATEALRKQREELDELTKSYNKNLNAVTKRIDPAKVKALVVQAGTSEDPERRAAALQELADIYRGIDAQRKDAEDNSDRRFKQRLQEQVQAQKAAQEDLDRLSRKREEVQAKLDKASPGSGTAVNLQQQARILDTGITEAGKRLAESKKGVDDYSKGIDGAAARLRVLGEDAKTAFGITASIFTPQSVKIAEEQLIPLLKSQEEAAKLKAELLDIPQKAKALGVDIKVATDQTAAAFERQNEQTRIAGENLQKAIAAESGIKGISPQALGSLELLRSLTGSSSAALEEMVRLAKANPSLLTGKSAPTPTPAATGTRQFTGKDTESEARKLAKAQADLERANIQASNRLADEQARQTLARMEDEHRRGLSSLQDYYDDRRKIQLAANQRDIDDKVREINAINELELRDPAIANDPAAKTRALTQVAGLKGQIDVLREQRKEIVAENARDLRDATLDFNQKVFDEMDRLVAEGLLTADASSVFLATLRQMEVQYADTIARLRSEGEGVLADALLSGFSVEAFKKAVEPAMRSVALLFAQLDQQRQRIDIARAGGEITIAEASVRTTQAINTQLPLLQTQLQIMQQQLATMRAVGDVSSRAYQEMALAVDEVIIRMQELQLGTDSIARSVNEGLVNDLERALNTLEPTLESLRNVVLQLLLDIVNNIKAVFAKQLAEEIAKAIGSVGTGGLGGFIQGVFNKLFTSAGADVGAKAVGAVGAAGATQAVGAAGAAAGLGGKTAEAAATAAATTALTALTPAASAVASFFGIVTLAADALAVALAAAATAATSGAVVGAVFHKGGRVGSSPPARRLVNPAIFANAPRYHGGGVAGLKPGEVPAILQQGERVLTERQYAMQQAAAAGGGRDMAIRNVLVTDPSFVTDAMSSSQGERTLLSFVKKNKIGIRQQLGL